MRHLGLCGFNISNNFFFLKTSKFEVLTIHNSDISHACGIKMKQTDILVVYLANVHLKELKLVFTQSKNCF